MLKEFKEFAMKGNLVDLAVGFILGGAFATVVSSLVNDIIMPPVGLLLGGVDFSSLFVPLDGGEYISLAEATQAGAPTLNYGLFINNTITFLIVAVVMFFIIKAMNTMKKKEEAAPSEPPRQEVLLEEIRNLLAKSAK